MRREAREGKETETENRKRNNNIIVTKNSHIITRSNQFVIIYHLHIKPIQLHKQDGNRKDPRGRLWRKWISMCFQLPTVPDSDPSKINRCSFAHVLHHVSLPPNLCPWYIY